MSTLVPPRLASLMRVQSFGKHFTGVVETSALMPKTYEVEGQSSQYLYASPYGWGTRTVLMARSGLYLSMPRMSEKTRWVSFGGFQGCEAFRVSNYLALAL